MSFLEIEFPRQLSFGSAGGRAFFTSENEGFSGWKQWNQNWEYPLADWTITVKSLQNSDGRISDFETLYAFFLNMKGKANGFRFWAPADNTGTGEFIATGDGATTVFQLQKTYSISGASFAIPVTKPITSAIVDYQGNSLSGRPDYSAPVIYVNGTPTSVTLDYTTGKITFGAAPAVGATITADFQFHFPVHFKTDKFNAQVEKSYARGKEAIFNLASIPIEEIRILSTLP